MDRALKGKLVEELGQIFESSGVVVVSRYEGMTVAEMQDLRAQMREVGGSVRVAKNRLAKIALDGKPCASIADLLTGMTVLAYSEDPVAAAKVVEAYSKGNPKLDILGGAMGENALDVAGVKAVAAMPSREELIASIVGCMVHLPATSPGPLAHLQAISQAFSRPSKRRLLKQPKHPRGFKPVVGTHLLIGKSLKWLI